MSEINFTRLTEVKSMTGEDSADLNELKAMLARAEAYIGAFSWCPEIKNRYLGVGISGVLALFLFELQKPIQAGDSWLWVVEGDLPSAYFVIDHAPDPQSALNVYCQLMDDWADVVIYGLPLSEVFPVSTSPTAEHAKMLQSRTKYIREKIIPSLS